MQHIHACRFVYNKAIQKLARCHEKVSNQRNDFLHKLSNRVVGENQAIAVESLNVAGMQKNHCLAQSISDVSWSAFFTMLEYKCQMHGKTLLKIGRFEPSSKICNCCGYIKQDLVLADREWIQNVITELVIKENRKCLKISKYAILRKEVRLALEKTLKCKLTTDRDTYITITDDSFSKLEQIRANFSKEVEDFNADIEARASKMKKIYVMYKFLDYTDYAINEIREIRVDVYKRQGVHRYVFTNICSRL